MDAHINKGAVQYQGVQMTLVVFKQRLLTNFLFAHPSSNRANASNQKRVNDSKKTKQNTTKQNKKKQKTKTK